ncbi:hypothetical protein [Sphingomonas sp. PB1R3]|uniref:hypothetical protein n=1 Tax=Sphingomonas flavida TaxID=3096154 RepID=UPI002FCB25C0
MTTASVAGLDEMIELSYVAGHIEKGCGGYGYLESCLTMGCWSYSCRSNDNHPNTQFGFFESGQQRLPLSI